MKISPLMIIGGLGAAYLFLTKTGGASSGVVSSTLLPGGSSAALPVSQTQSTGGGGAAASSALVGVNSFQRGGNGSYDLVSNYQQLVAAYPNLLNPNYQLNNDELNQYLANYVDLREGIPTWPGGLTPANVQKHWNQFGVAEHRIFVPMNPPSTGHFIPPASNAKSSGGGGFVNTATGVLGSIAKGSGEFFGSVFSKIIGIDGALNDAEIQYLMTGGKVLKDILPFYAKNQPVAVKNIEDKFDSIVNNYI